MLRQWQREDWPAFARINADPLVMEYYPNTLSRRESNAMAQKHEVLLSKNGWGLWEIELASKKAFMGFFGLHETT